MHHYFKTQGESEDIGFLFKVYCSRTCEDHRDEILNITCYVDVTQVSNEGIVRTPDDTSSQINRTSTRRLENDCRA